MTEILRLLNAKIVALKGRSFKRFFGLFSASQADGIVARNVAGGISDEFPLEELRITERRTDAEIRQAYRDGRIAEMTPHQAGSELNSK